MSSYIESALRKAFELCGTLTDEHRRVTHEGSGYGEVGSDTEIKADFVLAQAITETLREDPTPQVILVEGHGTHIVGDPKIARTVDPLDGSLNFKRRERSLGLPFSSVIAEFESISPLFGECSAAGVIDLRSGDLWSARFGAGSSLNGKICRTSGMKLVDKALGTIIIADFYYPWNRDIAHRAFSDFRGYFRSPGSAGYEMALVASGSADLYISAEQKCDVLGAGYLLVTQAGGAVVDFDGNDLGSCGYRFEAQQLVIMAATRALAEHAVYRIKNMK